MYIKAVLACLKILQKLLPNMYCIIDRLHTRYNSGVLVTWFMMSAMTYWHMIHILMYTHTLI
jgi:hypothetical protein